MAEFLIVGAGLFGSVCARELKNAGRSVSVIDRRNHIAGNAYTEETEEIHVHQYGPHIFHTNDKNVWEYVNRFAEFNRFTNAPLAKYKGELYSLPFNMNTFREMWGVATPEEAKTIIEKQRAEIGGEPENLEQQAISMVGRDIYKKLVKGYTEKQWGRSCEELPAEIIKRLPVRFTFDNSYFSDRFQGVPEAGYTKIVEKLLDGVEVRLNTDFRECRNEAERIIYTGAVDEYFGYCFGPLQYRSLRFENETLMVDNFQGNAVVNYTDRETPWTRIIEHKHFTGADTRRTVITKEFPEEWEPGKEPYYPINDARNMALYRQYDALAKLEEKTYFGGRLGTYRYLNMDQVVKEALILSKKIINTTSRRPR